MYYQRFLTSRNIYIDVWFTQLRHEMRSAALTKILNTILSKTKRAKARIFFTCVLSEKKIRVNFS